MRIGYVTPELSPFAKVGGLADVSAALPRALHDLGHDVRVVVPLYGRIDREALALKPVEGMTGLSLDLAGAKLDYRVLTAPIHSSGPPGFFVDCPPLYGGEDLYGSSDDEHLRFVFLCRAGLEIFQRMQWAPDIVHSHDWPTALLPLYLRSVYAWDQLFASTRSVFTIHNLGYQGYVPADRVADLGLGEHQRLLHQKDLAEGHVSLLKTGLMFAHCLTTVSPTYAREIQEPDLGMGLDDLLRQRSSELVGILNGIDDQEWNPTIDPHLTMRYSRKSLWRKAKNKEALLNGMGLPYVKSVPLVGIVTRLTAQKGLDLVMEVAPELLRREQMQMIVLGSGEPRFEQFFRELQAAFPAQVCFYSGFSNELAHRIEAGSDMFLMPSRYEPCGLNQMYSLVYGTVPIVRRTGGLADTVEQFDPSTGRGTGFVFEHYTAQGLRWAMDMALRTYADPDAWSTLVQSGMAQDFSWETQAKRYLQVYEQLTR